MIININKIESFVLMIILTIVLGLIIFFFLALVNFFYPQAENITVVNQTAAIQSKGELNNLLEKELITIPNGDCYDYASYYNSSLSKYNEGLKPPERVLDIRWLRSFDVCNGLTLCDDYHTFLVVGGFAQECILDQKEIKCIDLDIK